MHAWIWQVGPLLLLLGEEGGGGKGERYDAWPGLFWRVE